MTTLFSQEDVLEAYAQEIADNAAEETRRETERERETEKKTAGRLIKYGEMPLEKIAAEIMQ